MCSWRKARAQYTLTARCSPVQDGQGRPPGEAAGIVIAASHRPVSSRHRKPGPPDAARRLARTCHDHGMPPYDWSWSDGHTFAGPEAWAGTVDALPVGTVVTVRVIGSLPFGSFLTIDGHPGALGLMDVSQLTATEVPPPVGAVVDAVVTGHAHHNRQVRVRPRRPELAD